MEFVNGRDMFAVLPTGYGKTLCYACLPLIFDELASRTTPSIIHPIIHPSKVHLTPSVRNNARDSNKFKI